MRLLRLLSIPTIALTLTGCGLAMQRASVSRGFQSRFGCQSSKLTRVSDGYRVEGCGRSAEYVCFAEPVTAGDPPAHGDTSVGEVLGASLFAAAFAGANERCTLAYSESSAGQPARVASAAPAPVRSGAGDGEVVVKTRVLFAGGYLRALAKPNESADRVLLIVHAIARMAPSPCEAELFHDGVRVPVLAQAREGAYEARLLVPLSALENAARAARFSGSVCGVDFTLDASGLSTLGLFVAHFHEQLARVQRPGGNAIATPEPAPAVEPATP